MGSNFEFLTFLEYLNTPGHNLISALRTYVRRQFDTGKSVLVGVGFGRREGGRQRGAVGAGDRLSVAIVDVEDFYVAAALGHSLDAGAVPVSVSKL